jgi:hypothetical protein
MNRSLFRRQAPAFSVFALTLAWRLIAFWRLSHSPYAAPVTGDMKFYTDWGLGIANGQWTDFHAFYGEPLYAYFLAGIFALGGHSLVWIGLVQAVVDAGTAVLIVKIANLVFIDSPRRARFIGLIAALGWAFFTPAAAYCALLIPTSLVVAVWWFCIWWLLRRTARARWLEWFWIALLLGLSAMLSAAVLFLLPLFVAALLGRRDFAALAVVVGIVIGTAPAWAHNLFIARDPVFLSAHGGLNLWIGNNPEANGYPKIPAGLPSEQSLLLQRSIQIAEADAGHPLPRSAVSHFWSAKARHYIATHFFDWLALLAMKIRDFWSNFQYDDLGSITALRDAGIIFPGIRFGLLAALGLPGMLFAARNPKARWLIAAILLQMIALLPVFINERYRLAAVPGLLLFSAFLVTELQRYFTAARWRPLALTIIVLLASSFFVFLPPNDPVLRSLDNYKAGHRELVANDFPHAEKRLRLAFAQAVPANEVTSAVAHAFGDSAREKWRAGQEEPARATVAAALRMNPADETLLQLREELQAR